MKCFREIAQRSCPREGVTPFLWTLVRDRRIKKRQNQNKRKKKGKKSGESSFQQRDGFVFRASLSKTLSFVVARKGKGAALFRTTRVIIFRV